MPREQEQALHANPAANVSDYDLRNLVGHLVNAGRLDHLYRLLGLQTADGRNAWFDAKERARDASSYVVDVVAALAAAQELPPAAASGPEVGTGLAAEYRYGLLRTSITSLDSRTPPELLPALVQHGLWSLKDALTSASRRPAFQREKALSLLLPLIEDETQRVALAREVRDAIWKRKDPADTWAVKVLAVMAPHLPLPTRQALLSDLVSEITSLIASADQRSEYADSLKPVAQLLSDRQVEALLSAALEALRWYERSRAVNISAKYSAWRVLEVLASRSPLALTVRLASQMLGWRGAETLMRLALNLPVDQGDDALREMVAAAMECGAADILSQVLPFTSGDERAAVLRRAIDVGHREEDPASRAMTLLGLARQVEDETVRSELLSAVHEAAMALRERREFGAEGPASRAVTLLGLARQVEDETVRSELLSAVHEAAMALREQRSLLNPFTMESLTDMTDDLPDGLRAELLQCTLTAGRRLWSYERVRVLAAVARHLDDPHRTQVLTEAVQALAGGRVQGWEIEPLVPVLPAALLPLTLRITRRVGDEKVVQEAVSALAPFRRYRSDDDLIAASKAASDAFGFVLHKVDALVALAERLSPGQRSIVLAEALDVAVDGSDFSVTAASLAALAPLVAAERRGPVLRAWNRAVKYAKMPVNPLWRAKVLSGLLDASPIVVSNHRRKRVLAAALRAVHKLSQQGGYGFEQAELLAALVPHVPDEQRAPLLTEALKAVRTDPDFPEKARALAAIASRLSEEERAPVLAEAEAVLGCLSDSEVEELRRIEAFIDVAVSSPSAKRRELLDRAAVAAQQATSRADALAKVAPHFEEPGRSRMLAAAVAEIRSSGSYHVWKDLRLGLGLLSTDDFRRIVRSSPDALTTRNRESLCHEVLYLAALLIKSGGPKTAEELTQALQDVQRWWP